MQLFDRYAAQRLLEKRKRSASLAKDRKLVESLAAFAGEQRAVASIVKKDVRDWIEARASMPAGYEKMARYKGLTLPAAVKVASSHKFKRVSAKTLNSYLSAVSAFFSWLIARDLHPGPSPCHGVFYDAPKGDKPRPPFTSEQLNSMLKSPLFTGFEGAGREHLAGLDRTQDWRYWIPLICLFTGARVSEIAQLNVGDVREVKGIWLIYIRHDEDAGQSTKSDESRIVPVHSRLIQIGFLDYCLGRREAAAPGEGLFPGAQDLMRFNPGDRASRFWRHYLKRIGIKSDREGGDGLGVHSFRHTIADRFREEAELLDVEIAFALGHTVKTVTSGYGRVSQGTAAKLQSMFEAVRFEGVSFDPLISDRKSEGD